MGYKIGILTLHGMGTQKEGYSACWESRTRRRLAPLVSAEGAFEEVFYQEIMQRQQTKLWDERLGWQIKSL